MTDRDPGAAVSRRTFALLGAGAVTAGLVGCTETPDEPTDRRTSTPVGGYRPVAIGGGGWVTGFAQSGAITYARTDVGGAYALGPQGVWRQLLTVAAVGDDVDPADYRVDAIACAATDARRVALLVAPSDSGTLGNLLLSKNGGVRWTRSRSRWPVAETTDGAGGDRIAFDPQDDSRLVVATGDRQLYASDDFGGTWSTLPVPSAGTGTYSAVLATSAGEGTPFPVLWLAVVGSGLWRSADRGGSWTKVHPLKHPMDRISDLQPSDGGLLLCVESMAGTGGLFRADLDGGGATSIGPSAVSARSIAVDPTDPDHGFLVPSYVDPSQVLYASSDLTAARPMWTSRRWSIGGGGSSTWPERVTLETLSSGQVRYVDDRLLYAEGMGVWDIDATGGAALLTLASSGIEELVGNSVLKPADGPLLTASFDRGVLAVTPPTGSRPTVTPLRRGFGSAWDLSVSPTDPTFVAAVLDDHQDPTGRTVHERRASGYSTDGGRTWTRFPALQKSPPADLLFGNIAISADDNDNLVWLPSNLSGTASAVYWTADRGTTWVRAHLLGLTEDDLLHPTFTLARKALVADPRHRGQFTIFGSTREGTPVLWRSTDRGASWSKVATRGLETVRNARYGVRVLAIGSGLLAVTGTSDGGVLRGTPAGDWTSDVSVRGGVALAAGPRQANGPADAVYLYAGAPDDAGLHVSIDGAKTWRRCAGPVLDLAAPVRSIAADPRASGRVYLATGGSGYAVIDVALRFMR
ncbi:hypothetical protein [uncultured Amnibacterium sp.]|uniref:hypothetical protein n=1 Tax=uncultured Amnibacterium sp. TaxID=1631851 RepID=UPI0035C99AEE